MTQLTKSPHLHSSQSTTNICLIAQLRPVAACRITYRFRNIFAHRYESWKNRHFRSPYFDCT